MRFAFCALAVAAVSDRRSFDFVAAAD